MPNPHFWSNTNAVIRGNFPIGVTKYLFWPGTTWASRVTSTHHFWTMIPLVMWACGGGLEWRALPLSFIVVAINVLLSRWMTPHSINFPKDGLGSSSDGDDRGELERKYVLYLNLNLAHELWTDLNIGILLIGEGRIPYMIRLLVWWCFCHSLVYGFLYCIFFYFLSGETFSNQN
jgi:hypothetical protein